MDQSRPVSKKGRVTQWASVISDAHASGVLSVAFAPDGKTLASGSADGNVKLWHVPTGDELATLKADAVICSVAFLPHGDTLATGGTDKSVTLWHVNAKEEVLRARDD